MSFKTCVEDKLRTGEVDSERAQAAFDFYDEVLEEFSQRMSRDAAEVLAGKKVFDTFQFQAREKKRQALLQIKVATRRLEEINTYKNSSGQKDLAKGYEALFDRDDLAPYNNLEAQRKVILGQAHAHFSQGLAKFRRNLVGEVRNKATIRNLVREAFGETTGDQSAKELASAWSDTTEMLRLRSNAAGMHIPKRKDWGMPQTHNTLRIREAGKIEWINFIRDKIDFDRMFNEVTGQKIRPAEVQGTLEEIWETLAHEGMNKIEPSFTTGVRKLANRRADHRFIPFKDADSFFTYQDKFGKGDSYSVMMGHLEGISRDIARLEIFGPNDAATRRFLETHVMKEAVERDVAGEKPSGFLSKFSSFEDRAKRTIRTANNIMDLFSGAATAPIDGAVARSFAGLRSGLTAIQLGSASISALSDLSFQRLAAKMSALPQVKVIGTLLKNLGPNSETRGILATRLGLIAENWSSVAAAQQRYVGEISGPEFSKRLADFVIRASGLSAWTQAGRWGFGMEFMGKLAEDAGKPFKELHPDLQSTMKRYGINSDQWEVIRKTDQYDASVDVPEFSGQGAKFLRPEDILARQDLDPGQANDLTNSLMRMIQGEIEFATPSSSPRARVFLTGGSRPGTLQGELLQSFAMYKNFAVTLMQTHVRRSALQEGAFNKGKAFADLVISASVMGALALQLKDMAKGRDPRPMVGPKAVEFWSAAILQGGGLGIFGDFLFADLNRFDRGIASTIAGPVAGFYDDVLRRGLIGNLAELAQGKETNFGREFVGALRRYTPGGSLWYLRLGYERLILDQIQNQIDPKFKKRARQLERRYKKQFGQKFFFRPGKVTPDRAPDFSKIFGE